MTCDSHTDPTAAFEAELGAEERRRRQSEALWRMSAEERIAAMWDGRLTLHQLTQWSSRRPDEVPKIGGEFAYIVMSTADWIEARERATPRCRHTGKRIPECSCEACHAALIAVLEDVELVGQLYG